MHTYHYFLMAFAHVVFGDLTVVHACGAWHCLQHWETKNHLSLPSYTPEAPPFPNSACTGCDGGGGSHQRPHVPVWMPDRTVSPFVHSPVLCCPLSLLPILLHWMPVGRYFDCDPPTLDHYMRPLFGAPSEEE